MIGVLALQGGVAEHLTALERGGATARPVRRPEELASVHGIVLPGGESTAMTRLLDAFEMFEPLRERLAAGMPAYGSCAGMVLLGSQVLDDRPDSGVRCLGALDIDVRRNAFGRQVDSFEADLDFEGIGGGPLHTVFIRAPRVDRTGSDVRVLATVPGAENSLSPEAAGPTGAGPDATAPVRAAGTIVAVRQGPVLATSFHPELIRDDGRVHHYFVQTVREHVAGAREPSPVVRS